MKIANINFVIGRSSTCSVTYSVSRGDKYHTWNDELTCGPHPCNVGYSFHNVHDALKRQFYGPSSVYVLVGSSSHCSIKGSHVGLVVTPLFTLFMESLIMFSTVIRVSHGGGKMCRMRANSGEERVVAGRDGIVYHSTQPTETEEWREISGQIPLITTFTTLEPCDMKIAHINFVIGRNSHCSLTYTVHRTKNSQASNDKISCESSLCNVSYSFHNVQDALKLQSYSPSMVTVIVSSFSGSHCSIKGYQHDNVFRPLFSLFMEFASSTDTSPSQGARPAIETTLSSTVSSSLSPTTLSSSEGMRTEDFQTTKLKTFSPVSSVSIPPATILPSELTQGTAMSTYGRVTRSSVTFRTSSNPAQGQPTTADNDEAIGGSSGPSVTPQSTVTMKAASTHHLRPTEKSYMWMIGTGVGALLLLGIILSVLLYYKVKHISSVLHVSSDSSGGVPVPIEVRTLACENPQYGVAEDIPVRFNVSSSQSGYSDVDVQYVDGNQVLSEDTTYDTMIRSYRLHDGKSDAKPKPSTQVPQGGEQQQLDDGVGEQQQYDRLDITLRRDSYAEVVPRNLRTQSTNRTATA
ncbi:uncharacterized protein LOC135812895 [Sycon ciliatum]|uniref:uncharacterized protein LOC135812895 n=1 Tax=Sycon ciliatum TaxID=27933 RepID=UPI0031F6C24D